MVSIPQWDQALARLERYGQSGGISKQAPQERINDEITRQLDAIRSGVSLLIRQARHAPDWSNVFVVSHANAGTDNHVTIVHDLGYTTILWVVLSYTSQTGSGTPPSYWAGIRFLSSDPRTATFQLSGQAIAQLSVFRVMPMVSGVIPPGATEEANAQ